MNIRELPNMEGFVKYVEIRHSKLGEKELRARTIKSKDIPEDFKIVDSIEDQIIEFVKTHKWVYGTLLIKEFGMTQAGNYRVLRKLAKSGVLKDHGCKNILEKGSKQYRSSRLYERIDKK